MAVRALGTPLTLLACELIKRQANKIIPLNEHLGIKIVSVGEGRAEAVVAFGPKITNHLGTAHATAIFGLAEAAAGCAIAGAVASRIRHIRLVAIDGKVEFLHPGRSDLRAEAIVAMPAKDILAKLTAERKMDCEVTADVGDLTTRQIAKVAMTWRVSLRR